MNQETSGKIVLKKPVKGVSVETFVKEYKGQSQMHARKIKGERISADTYDLIDEFFNVAKKQ